MEKELLIYTNDLTLESIIKMIENKNLKVSPSINYDNGTKAKLKEQIKLGFVLNSVLVNNRGTNGNKDLHVVSGIRLINTLQKIFNENKISKEIDEDLINNITVRVATTIRANEEELLSLMF